jgi:hypothetical protein
MKKYPKSYGNQIFQKRKKGLSLFRVIVYNEIKYVEIYRLLMQGEQMTVVIEEP